MKKVSILAVFFGLLLTAGAAFAQTKAANFAGTWELDASKSKMGERNRVESMTLDVKQTDKDLTVATTTKRAARPEGGQPPNDPNGTMRGGGGNGGMRGGMGRGGMGGGNGTVTYSLDGKEMTIASEPLNNMPAMKTMLKSKMEKDGKLKLMSTRNFDTPMGSMSVKTTDTWELVDGGKGLKVTRDVETPNGAQTSEMYFNKKTGM